MSRDEELKSSEGAVVKIAFKKSYSPSPGTGSLRTTVLETCSPDYRCTSMNGMK
jgi:hypothetical protein